MPAAIIAGTGIYGLPGVDLKEEAIKTPYGEVTVWRDGDLVFVNRHAPNHTVPPHKVNYRGYIDALAQLGVKRVCAAFAVGLINEDLDISNPVLLSGYIDMTSGRDHTFFDKLNGGVENKGHVEMSRPFCPELSGALQEQGGGALQLGISVCTNGPRLETPAEIRWYSSMGADVVGMTLCPELPLARERGMSYAGLALPVNWASGIRPNVTMQHEGITEKQIQMTMWMMEALADTKDEDCTPAIIF